MTGKRPLALAACAVGCAVLAACSSSSPSTQAQAQAERAAVMPAARALYGQVTSDGVAWTAVITGSYALCRTDDPLATSSGFNSVQYTASALMGPFDSRIAYTTFSRQVVEALNAAGWDLKPATGASSQASYYNGRRNGLDLWLIEFDDQPSPGQTATIFLSGSCFTAGAATEQLLDRR